MKKILMVTLLAAGTIFAAAKKDAYDIRPDAAKTEDAPAAEKWQADNRDAIVAATTDEKLDAFVKDAASAAALLAKVKTGYQTCPMAATQIAATSQYVMRPGCSCPFACLMFWRQSKAEKRCVWASALLKAAEEAEEPDVKVFYLDQLRWCGCPKQADRIAAISSPKCKCVAQMAAIVAAELRQWAK